MTCRQKDLLFWREKQQLDSVYDFFKRKRDWSKYKDLILDYYLGPYLQIVKRIGKPILVVDCFAGAGRFDDGQSGSPLIIAKHLQELHDLHFPVTGYFIEEVTELYNRLKENVRDLTIPIETRFGSFREHVAEVTRLSQTHTVFVYVDPFKPTDVIFNDLEPVYDQLKRGGSVELLMNFMSVGFLRGVQSFRNRVMADGGLLKEHALVLKWNEIAGGTYWQQIAYDARLSPDEQADGLAHGYAGTLKKWFNCVLPFPVREKYKHKWPKYHLIFGSRHHKAAELMNRAMVKARREFVNVGFIKGYLFPNQPQKEVLDPHTILRIVVETSREVGRINWADLRVQATVANPAAYTDSEFNSAIKRAICEGKLASDRDGRKIEEAAFVWPVD